MIIRNIDRHVSRNFTEKEFFTKDPEYTQDGHYLDPRLIQAVQHIRDVFATPIRINSTFRTHDYNKRIGGAPNSYHTRGMAVDWMFTQNNMNNLDILKTSPHILSAIREMGIKGIIFYPTFVHFDTRENEYTKEI